MFKNDWDIEKVDWKRVGFSALISGVSSGLGYIKILNNFLGHVLIAGFANLGTNALCDDVHSFKDGAISFFSGAFISIISLGITRSIGKVLTQNGMKTINQSLNLQKKYNLLSLVYETKCYHKKQFAYKMRFVYTGQNWIYEEDKIGEILNDILSELLGKI